MYSLIPLCFLVIVGRLSPTARPPASAYRGRRVARVLIRTRSAIGFDESPGARALQQSPAPTGTAASVRESTPAHAASHRKPATAARRSVNTRPYTCLLLSVQSRQQDDAGGRCEDKPEPDEHDQSPLSGPSLDGLLLSPLDSQVVTQAAPRFNRRRLSDGVGAGRPPVSSTRRNRPAPPAAGAFRPRSRGWSG